MKLARNLTLEEAVAIRARSLAGETMADEQVSAAVATIQRAPTKRGHGQQINKSPLPDQLLKLLANGPVERDEFYGKAVETYTKAKRAQGPYSQLRLLGLYGLIRQEVVLTDLGRKRLGMKP